MGGQLLLSDSTCSRDMKVIIKHFCKFLLQMPVKQHFWPNDGSRMIVKRLSLCVLWWSVNQNADILQTSFFKYSKFQRKTKNTYNKIKMVSNIFKSKSHEF